MKIKQLLLILMVAIMAISVCACREETPDDSSSSSSTGGDIVTPTITPKPVDGSPLLFDEGMEFYNTAPSVLDVSENERYVFYTVNEVALETKSAIAVRKATKENGAWTYGEKQVVLTASQNGFDSCGVSDCDVVKGNFAYKGTDYSYIMAYEGTDNITRKNHKISFALANDLMGEWIKVSEIVLSAADSDGFGISQPSLVNYDKANKLMLFYSIDRVTYTVEALKEMDAADMENVKWGVENVLSEKGLKDKNDFVTFNNSDFAYDSANGMLYVVRNQNPASSQGTQLETAVQVNKILLTDLFTATAEWSIVKERIEWKDLRDENDEESMGWAYVYAASIAADAYGFVDNATNFDVALSVTSYDQNTFDYLYYQTITQFNVQL